MRLTSASTIWVNFFLKKKRRDFDPYSGEINGPLKLKPFLDILEFDLNLLLYMVSIYVGGDYLEIIMTFLCLGKYQNLMI